MPTSKVNPPRPTDAAERLRRCLVVTDWGTAWDMYREPSYQQGFSPWLTDMGTLSAAYLEAFPADDGDEIDAKFLRGVGAEKHPCHPDKWTFYHGESLPVGLWHVDDGWKAMLIQTENHASCIVRGLTTRGDVRRLASALGIPLEPRP